MTAFECPNCGDELQGITRPEPTDATAQPCGCPVGHLDTRDFAHDARAITEVSH